MLPIKSPFESSKNREINEKDIEKLLKINRLCNRYVSMDKVKNIKKDLEILRSNIDEEQYNSFYVDNKKNYLKTELYQFMNKENEENREHIEKK